MQFSIAYFKCMYDGQTQANMKYHWNKYVSLQQNPNNIIYSSSNHFWTSTDADGGRRVSGSPLTLTFEAPKLIIFAPYLIFP